MDKHEDTETFDQMRDQWAPEIGRFLMAFAKIEELTYAMMRCILEPPLYTALMNKLDLALRIDLIVAFLRSKPDPECHVFADLALEARKLAESRNLVAHNELTGDLYVDAQGHMQFLDFIRSRRNGDIKLQFQQLVEKRKRAEKLYAELLQAGIEAQESPAFAEWRERVGKRQSSGA